MNRQIYENYVKSVKLHGNLTKAAKALGISQPALSQGLSGLEREIGFKIFNRRSNPLTFTPEGELYYEHICRMDTLNDSFQKKISSYRDLCSKKAVIGAPAVYVNSVVIPVVEQLLETCPYYDITIKTGSLEELIGLALNGELDVFVSTSNDVPELFTLEKIYKESIVLCAPRNRGVKDISCIESERLICLEDTFPLQIQVNAYLESHGLTAARRLVVDQVALAVDLAERGMGICFASREAAANRELTVLPTDIVGRDIYMVYDSELYRSEACEAFIDKVRSFTF